MQTSPRIDPNSVLLSARKPRNKSVEKNVHVNHSIRLEIEKPERSRTAMKKINKSFDAVSAKVVKKRREEESLTEKNKEIEFEKKQKRSKEDVLIQTKVTRELNELCAQNCKNSSTVSFAEFCMLYIFNI